MSPAKTFDLQRVKFWQKILGLRDHKILPFVVGGDRMRAVTGEKPGGETASGFVEVYRQNNISKMWLNRETDDSQSADFIMCHEVLHLLNDGFYRFARDVVDCYVSDPTTKAYLLGNLEHETELLTCRLTEGYMRLKAMGERKKAGV